MNSYEKKPGTDGDYETISNLRLAYSFCAQPAAIECRVKQSSPQDKAVSYLDAGQRGVACNINRGLVCVDSLQENGEQCLDYEVRVFCTDNCVPTRAPTGTPTVTPPIGETGFPSAGPPTGKSGQPTPVPSRTSGGIPTAKKPVSCKQGFSAWMNVDRPTISHSFEKGGEGDHEDLEGLRYYYSFCAHPTSIMCRSATTGQMYQLTKDVDTICNTAEGFRCVNSKQASGKCDDYEISVGCECGGKSESR
jgi:hypothetical protein